jgi:phosphate transport system permease protein
VQHLRAHKREGLQRAALGDRLFIAGIFATAIVFVALVLGLVIELVQGSWISLRTFGLHFLASSEWNPVTQKFGAFPLIFGTVVSSLIALVIAGVVGILAAAYLADFAPRRLARPLAFVIELLAAVPSVVFGLWGLFVLAPAMRDFIDPGLRSVLGFLPLFQGPSYGIGLLTAGVLLALMIIPTVTAISRDVIAAIPEDQREASHSLGATRWETMAHVVLTSARAGIFGALILALGRALGETIAVTMVIGNRPQIVASLFAPSYSLASVIANEFTEATGDLYISALVELGLILLVISLVVNGIARLLMWTVFRKTGRAA